MKIAITSDLHGYLPDIHKCEVVLICGDISPLNIQKDHYKMEYWMRSEFANWVNNLPCNHVIMVAGNHDKYLEDIMNDEVTIYESITKPTKGKLEILYNNLVCITSDDNLPYFIWGTPYCKQFYNWSFMLSEKELIEKYAEMPAHCDIVLSHDSPKIGTVGTILQRSDNVDAGNMPLAKAIKEKEPQYVFCGHIHSGCHKLKTYRGYGTTKIANVSYLDENYQPVYNILYTEI